MICICPDQTSFGAKTGRWTPSAMASPDTSLPLLDVIAAELRLAGEVDELASLRAARRLLEEAFRAVNHAPTISDPQSITELKP